MCHRQVRIHALILKKAPLEHFFSQGTGLIRKLIFWGWNPPLPRDFSCQKILSPRVLTSAGEAGFFLLNVKNKFDKPQVKLSVSIQQYQDNFMTVCGTRKAHEVPLFKLQAITTAFNHFNYNLLLCHVNMIKI
jgi:hypothetical protein